MDKQVYAQLYAQRSGRKVDELPSLFNQGELRELQALSQLLGIDKYFDGDVTVIGSDSDLRSPHHLSEATAYALTAEAMAAAAIARQQGGK